MLDHLESNFSLTATQNINPNIRIDWRASYQDRAGGYTNFSSGEESEYLPFWLVSARLSYKGFRNSTLFLEINNLLDNEYLDFGYMPLPGRWKRKGLDMRVDLM